jgi:hypothetical protein
VVNCYPYHVKIVWLRVLNKLKLLEPTCRCSVMVHVITPPKIIPYYRLNHSIWSLSDNKETSHWVLPGLHPVNHLETQRGSNVCIKLPRRVQSALHINTNLPVESNYYNPLFMT